MPKQPLGHARPSPTPLASIRQAWRVSMNRGAIAGTCQHALQRQDLPPLMQAPGDVTMQYAVVSTPRYASMWGMLGRKPRATESGDKSRGARLETTPHARPPANLIYQWGPSAATSLRPGLHRQRQSLMTLRRPSCPQFARAVHAEGTTHGWQSPEGSATRLANRGKRTHALGRPLAHAQLRPGMRVPGEMDLRRRSMAGAVDGVPRC